MGLRCVWDPTKADRNIKKHGLPFDEAATVFADPFAAIFGDETHSTAESREIIIGHSALDRLVVVCFVEVTRGTIRIISARKATRTERKEYEEACSK